MTGTPSEQIQRLSVLVGRWHTEGWTVAGPGHPAERIDAIDTYRWLPGGAAILHLVDATVGEQKVEGAEIIGYDPRRGHYATQYFGTDGPTSYDASLSEAEDGSLVWEMRSEDTRFRGSLDRHRSLITGHWEQLVADAGWQPWMDIALTKQA